MFPAQCSLCCSVSFYTKTPNPGRWVVSAESLRSKPEPKDSTSDTDTVYADCQMRPVQEKTSIAQRVDHADSDAVRNRNQVIYMESRPEDSHPGIFHF